MRRKETASDRLGLFLYGILPRIGSSAIALCDIHRHIVMAAVSVTVSLSVTGITIEGGELLSGGAVDQLVGDAVPLPPEGVLDRAIDLAIPEQRSEKKALPAEGGEDQHGDSKQRQEQLRVGHHSREENSKADEEDIHQAEDVGRLAVVAAQIEQKVVQVRTIRLEWRAAFRDPKQKDPQGVVERYHQHGHRNHRDGMLPADHALHGQAVVDEGDRLYGQEETDDERTRVAHEDLGRREIVPEKTDNRRRKERREDRPLNQTGLPEPVAEKERGEQRHAAGQSVDAVDKVIGVDDDDHRKERQQKAHDNGKFTDAEDSSHGSEVETGA